MFMLIVTLLIYTPLIQFIQLYVFYWLNSGDLEWLYKTEERKGLIIVCIIIRIITTAR